MTGTLVIFDLKRIHDRATDLYPNHYLEGIDRVFVNGVLVVDGEQHTSALPEQVLRHWIKASNAICKHAGATMTVFSIIIQKMIEGDAKDRISQVVKGSHHRVGPLLYPLTHQQAGYTRG